METLPRPPRVHINCVSELLPSVIMDSENSDMFAEILETSLSSLCFYTRKDNLHSQTSFILSKDTIHHYSVSFRVFSKGGMMIIVMKAEGGKHI